MQTTYQSRVARPRTVLVVDDDPICLASTCRTIGAEYPVLATTCSDDAVRTARKARPDLIVYDIVQPGSIGGFARLAALSTEDPMTWDTPVIVLSGVSASAKLKFCDAKVRRYMRHSVRAFLKRTTSGENLMETIEKAIGASINRSRRKSSRHDVACHVVSGGTASRVQRQALSGKEG
jgi:response regulator RpfG family c-di-GMP phosphodiesterase